MANYRSVYTGAEIDEAITLIKGLVDNQIITSDHIGKTLVAAAGNFPLFHFQKGSYTTLKCLVSATSSDLTKTQVQEAILTYNGSDTYILTFHETGNHSNLFELSSSIVGDDVNLFAITKQANVNISAKRIALI